MLQAALRTTLVSYPARAPHKPAQYGSPKFLEQHDWIVQLNLQAHHNAVAHADEFVMEALVSHGKVDALVHGLLVSEVSAHVQVLLPAPPCLPRSCAAAGADRWCCLTWRWCMC